MAALFAVHPLRVESVAWIAERKDVLSGLCFVSTLWAYVWYVRGPFSCAAICWWSCSCLGTDGQADAGHHSVRAAVVGLLAAGTVCGRPFAAWLAAGEGKDPALAARSPFLAW